VNVWRLLQIFGAACLVVVMLTHVAERSACFPAWDGACRTAPGTISISLVLFLECILLLLGFLGNALIRRKNSN
jgi:hypothetical protein